VRPNVISLGSVGFAAIAGLALLATFWSCTGFGTTALFVAAAAGIQLRLLCNLMDGMVAVEGGMGGPLGNLYNDLPDRFADVFILLGAGYAVRDWECGALDGATLGWLAALAAVLTAYVRVLGAQAGAQQYFLGPMAKPHRMALMTLACLLAAGERLLGWPPRVLAAVLGLIVVGCAITSVRRLVRIAADLRARATPTAAR
jgi:phosphatidylglycerophosphate synthase